MFRDENMMEELFDVVVIGGGPAGMMAAGQAASCGARVLLLEKNDSLGKKLRITGGGRCNITNATYDIALMTERFGKKGRLLFPALSRFGVRETLDFFHERNLSTKIEAENRVFPQSDKADDVREVLIRFLHQYRVAIRYGASVVGLESENERIVGVKMKNGSILRAKAFVMATGGLSRPETGSTGEGLLWLERLGHTLVRPDTALVPVTVQDTWVKKMQGVSLSSVKLSIVHKERKHKGSEGKLLFTHFGVSGPLLLNMSRLIRECFGKGKTQLSLDIFPGVDTTVLDKRLQELFLRNMNKKASNVASDFISASLVPALFELSQVNGEKTIREITKQERLSLIATAKDMRMTVSGFLGMSKAIVSSGGVDVKEIDFKTMQSRLFSNLFVTGDLLDFNRPSGGYSLQICWTTGYLAGKNAAKEV